MGPLVHCETDVLLVGQMEGDLRVVNNFGEVNSQFGRLEIYRDGAWGTVCIDGFDFYEADIACKQLGFPYANRFDTVIELK